MESSSLTRDQTPTPCTGSPVLATGSPGKIPLHCCCFFKNLIDLFFGCAGSSLSHAGFSSYDELGLLFIVVLGASHCGGFSCGARALGTQASLLCGIWNLLGPGIFPDMGPPDWQADSYPLYLQENPDVIILTIMQCSGVMYIHSFVQPSHCPSQELSSSQTEILYPFKNNSPLPSAS